MAMTTPHVCSCAGESVPPSVFAAAAIILAGGSSRRMGQDKSMLLIKGKPIIELIRDQLRPLFGQRIIISANDPVRYAFLGLPVVTDESAGQGPLMGIACGLRASPCDVNLVIACDIPRIDAALVNQLIDRIGENDVMLPRTAGGNFEPLFAVYRKSILPLIDAALRRGIRRIIDVFDGARVGILAIDDAPWLRNLNTPADYREFVSGDGRE